MNWRGIYFSFIAVLFVVLSLSSLTDPRLVYGDPASDINVLVAGENFAKYGFSGSLGLPYFGYRGQYTGGAYTHYPAFPYWLNGALRSVGVDSLLGFRTMALLFSLATACLLPSLFLQLGLQPLTAYLASGLFVIHQDFLQYSDSLHQFPLDFLTAVLCLLCWVMFIKSRRWYLPVLSFLFFTISTWVSFEHFLYIPVLVVGFIFLLGNFRRDLGPAVFVCSAALITMILRLWQQSWLAGSFEQALQDLIGAADHRSSIGLLDFANHVQKRFINLNVALIPLFIWSLNKVTRQQWQKSELRWVSLFAVAGFAWWLVMRQHFAIHGHTNHLFLGFFAVAGSMLATKALSAKTRGSQIALALSTVVLLINVTKVPMLNRFVSLDPRGFERIQLLTSTQNKLNEYADSADPKIIFIAPFEDPTWAFPFSQDFRLIPQTEMCTANLRQPTILVKEIASLQLYQVCKDFLGKPLDLGAIWLFDPK